MKRITLIAIINISMLISGALAQQSRRVPTNTTRDSVRDTTENVMLDNTLSHDERLAKVRPERHMADKKMREILSDQQKKKLDQYEQGPHPEMHGTLSGTPAR